MSNELDPALTQRVRGILTALDQQLEETKQSADACVALAWQAGGLINEAKATLPGQLVMAWYESVGITPERALSFSRLANQHKTIEDLRGSNERRQAYLQLGLVPNKERPEVSGDIQLRPNSAHCFSVLNAFTRWHRVYSTTERDEARRVLRPVYDKLKELFE